jgi:ferredoxin-NADP reductase
MDRGKILVLMADLSPQLWRPATIESIVSESERTKTFRLKLSGPYPFMAGQHCSIQLRAPDGYTAARDYSFSSSPASGVVETTIAHAPHGEVSGWFCTQAEVGDQVEISAPIGRHFVWTPAQTEPILLIAGGVGVTPLMSILREHRASGATSGVNLFYSVRTFEDICFKNELVGKENVTFTLVDSQPDDWQGYTGIVTADMLRPLALPNQTTYVCGPTAYVEAVTHILTDQLGVAADTIKTERFG